MPWVLNYTTSGKRRTTCRDRAVPDHDHLCPSPDQGTAHWRQAGRSTASPLRRDQRQRGKLERAPRPPSDASRIPSACDRLRPTCRMQPSSRRSHLHLCASGSCRLCAPVCIDNGQLFRYSCARKHRTSAALEAPVDPNGEPPFGSLLFAPRQARSHVRRGGHGSCLLPVLGTPPASATGGLTCQQLLSLAASGETKARVESSTCSPLTQTSWSAIRVGTTRATPCGSGISDMRCI